MKTLSNVEMSAELQSNDVTHHTLAPLRTARRLAELKPAEKSKTENRKGSRKPSSPTESRPRLGKAVSHSRYGRGEVLAHWPGGTLLVRFDNAAKNRLVWPSFLDRVNGHRR